ncbi:MAG: ECF transporter S component [Clostridia bacterium]|nr:ECF transporter S component [Clostridia bacterium]
MKKKRSFNSNDSIRSLVYHSLLTAVIAMLTLFASVPLPVGNGGAYLNAGDAAVYASAFILGPWGGAAVSGVGSALADVLHGSPVYVPATFLIKAAMALICGLLLKRFRRIPPVIAGLVMPAGYFAYELIVFDISTALFGLWTNAVQYAFGAAAGILLFHAFEKAGIVKFGKGAFASEKSGRADENNHTRGSEKKE